MNDFFTGSLEELLLRNGWEPDGKTKDKDRHVQKHGRTYTITIPGGRQKFRIAVGDAIRRCSIGPRTVAFWEGHGRPHRLRTVRDMVEVIRRIEGEAWGPLCEGALLVENVGGVGIRREDEHGEHYNSVRCSRCDRDGRVYGGVTLKPRRSRPGETRLKDCRFIQQGG